MTWRHDLQGSLSTPRQTIGKSCAVQTETEKATSDSSGFRVGSFHVPARGANAVPTLLTQIGTGR